MFSRFGFAYDGPRISLWAMNLLIFSCSYNPRSRSAIMARAAQQRLQGRASVELHSLVELGLPFCDGYEAYGHAAVNPLKEKIAAADGILLAAPVYNYDLNAGAKNLLEMTGDAWTGAVVGFLCAAGGNGSYMSVMPFANSLMLDFRCVILPRFVFATGGSFDGSELSDPKLEARIDRLCGDLLAFSEAIGQLSRDAGQKD